jgi:hypothetical protein
LTANLCESGQSGRDLHLHVNGAGLDPLKGYGGYALDHAAPLPQRKLKQSIDKHKNIKGTWKRASG